MAMRYSIHAKSKSNNAAGGSVKNATEPSTRPVPNAVQRAAAAAKLALPKTSRPAK